MNKDNGEKTGNGRISYQLQLGISLTYLTIMTHTCSKKSLPPHGLRTVTVYINKKPMCCTSA